MSTQGAAVATSVTLITARNCGQFLQQAINSALPQCDEVIVYDDASTDAYSLLPDSDQATVLHGNERIGPMRAKNLLLDIALQKDFEWIQFLDGDDYLLPGKIAKQIATGKPVTYTNFVRQVWRDGLPVKEEPRNTGKQNLLVSLLKHQYNAPTSSLLFHRSAFDQVRWDEDWSYMTDRKLVLDLFKVGFNPCHVDVVGCVYRWGWSDQQMTCQPEPILRAHRQRFMSELYEWLGSLRHPDSVATR